MEEYEENAIAVRFLDKIYRLIMDQICLTVTFQRTIFVEKGVSMARDIDMTITCKERVDAYFENMHKYHGDVVIRVRFLCKIFKVATDSRYSIDERIMVLKRLISDIDAMKNNGENEYAILDASYCYKLNKILDSGLDVPVWRSESLIVGTPCSMKKIPEKIYEDMKKKYPLSIAFNDSIKPDKEILELYNVQIAEDHFYYRQA